MMPLMNLTIPANLYLQLNLIAGPMAFNFVDLTYITKNLFNLHGDDYGGYN